MNARGSLQWVPSSCSLLGYYIGKPLPVRASPAYNLIYLCYFSAGVHDTLKVIRCSLNAMRTCRNTDAKVRYQHSMPRQCNNSLDALNAANRTNYPGDYLTATILAATCGQQLQAVRVKFCRIRVSIIHVLPPFWMPNDIRRIRMTLRASRHSTGCDMSVECLWSPLWHVQRTKRPRPPCHARHQGDSTSVSRPATFQDAHGD